MQSRNDNDLNKDWKVKIYQEKAYQENEYFDHDALNKNDDIIDFYDYHDHDNDLNDLAVVEQNEDDYQNFIEYMNADFISTFRLKQSCRLCEHIFYFKNKFHRHFRVDHFNKKRIET